jgi:hypothetical protein
MKIYYLEPNKRQRSLITRYLRKYRRIYGANWVVVTGKN